MQRTRQIVFSIILIIGNWSLFEWTYPAGGYGALAAMFFSPILNLGSVLLYWIVIRILKYKNKAVSSEITAPLMFSLALMLIMEILAFTIYSHGGC